MPTPKVALQLDTMHGFDGMQVSVMHAFIDEGDYSSMTIDKALRKMLKDFKLPGELVCR